MQKIDIRKRLRSTRLRRLSWPRHPVGRRGYWLRPRAAGRITWLGPEFLFDSRTGRIQAL